MGRAMLRGTAIANAIVWVGRRFAFKVTLFILVGAIGHGIVGVIDWHLRFAPLIRRDERAREKIKDPRCKWSGICRTDFRD